MNMQLEDYIICNEEISNDKFLDKWNFHCELV